jgi:hypothetical protein
MTAATADAVVEHDLDNPRRDGEGFLVDGHGQRLYKVEPETAAAHQIAVDAGWRHSYEVTPFHNLRSLVEVLDRTGAEADRQLLGRLAFKFVCGYGPNSTPRALDRLGVSE